GFNVKIYENESYVDVKYFYRTKSNYVSLQPQFYALTCNKNQYNLIKILRESEIKEGINRYGIKNEGTGFDTFESCEKNKACDKIIKEIWLKEEKDKTGFSKTYKLVEIQGNFSKIEHLFRWQLVRYYLENSKEQLRIYVL
ncbi:MAG: hypothetical protein ACK4UV_12305, partial [Ignavibacterium sp.]